MDARLKTDHDLQDLELRLLAPERSLLIGAIGGALAVLVYKTCELIVRGVMGQGFQLSPSDRVTTILLMIAIAALIHLVPSRRREINALRRENDEKLRKISDDLDRIERERK